MLTIHTTLISQYLSCSCYSNGFWWIHSSKRKLLTTRFHNLAVLLPFLSRVIFTVRVQALSNLEQLQCLAVADTGVTSVCIYLNAILVVTGRDGNKAEGGWRGMGATCFADTIHSANPLGSHLPLRHIPHLIYFWSALECMLVERTHNQFAKLCYLSHEKQNFSRRSP